ncbi:MAG: 4Fe-4S dicluster domain-containing protein [Synergistaceae bacterium]|jgi:ferredoxin|nr:4Fe-4S dicluster domain-containing protein [Synergistaceae bacterium]
MTDVIGEHVFRQFLASLEPAMRLAGPVRDGKIVEFREGAPEDFVLDDSVSYKAPKEFYFPQVERLITFQDGEAESEPEPRPVAVTGARPCDLEALRVMRAVFLNGRYKDPFFEQRQARGLVIGLACDARKPGCFCDALGLDMKFSDFCDILLERARGEGAFKVTHLSGRGAEALAKFPGTADVKPAPARVGVTRGRALGLDLGRGEKEFFGLIDWEDAAAACQGCGMCTYICPTCHCFEFRDVTENGVTGRYRCWDSCMFPRFTLHASGHNPRASRAARYRQRVLHKYLYVAQNTGHIACTGCGRCVRSCPVGINIKSIVESLTEAEK